MGQIEVGKAEDELIASGIGSCLVITFYDPKHKIGALAHTMLPARRMHALSPSASLRVNSAEESFEARSSEHERRKNPESPDTRYADTAIDEMLKRIEAEGAKREFIEAKIIGGANMFSAFESSIARDNISYSKEILKKLGVVIAGECVGGSQGRSVEFLVASGVVTVKTKF